MTVILSGKYLKPTDIGHKDNDTQKSIIALR